MTHENFQAQVKRLQNEWKNSYGTERVKALWDALHNTPDEIFTRAVTRCLQTQRASPLVLELSESIDEIRKEDEQLRNYSAGGRDFAEVLRIAETRAPNPAFAKECVKVLEEYNSGKISKEEFHKKCDLLDEAAKLYSHECEHCANTGYVMKPDANGTNALHRCKCRLGSVRPHELPAPAQKDGSREMVSIPQWNGGAL